MYDMDVNAFRAWLQSFSPEETVGRVADETRCPVACWMGQHDAVFRVSGSSVFIDDGVSFSRVLAPVWVPRFVAELDDLYDYHPVCVSAASALAVLDKVVVEGLEVR